ncbi:Multidrug resistance efflux pump [Oscillospiraceae bacterium]|nr:Multidrug resistance efflux pump [Oscillospiraceae bacterium]
MADRRKNRSWVVRAIISFVAILALLTFFSNTIMNATIPKVMAQNATKGNLSFTNSATGVIEADTKTEVKSINGREIDQVLVRNYVSVEEGDVLLTLKPAEDLAELDKARADLADLEAAAQAAALTPSDDDFSVQQDAIRSAQDTLNAANEALNAANNRDSLIATAQGNIDYYSSIIPGLEATADAEAAVVADYNDQITAAETELNNINLQIANLENMGVTLPSETAAPSETSSEGTEETAPTTAALTTQQQNLVDLNARKAELEAQIADLNTMRDAAQGRLDEASASLGAAQASLASAQADLQAAQALPSVADAQADVNAAQSSLNRANTALSNAQATAAATAVTTARTNESREEQIAAAEEKIAKLEESLTCTEIVAPCSGLVYGLVVSDGNVMTENQVILTIIPDDSTYSVKFNFKTSVAQNLSEGMELTVNDAYIDQCRITNIYPDESDPREKRVVKCALSSLEDIFPGTQITVTADRSNANYDHVIPASAVIHDNSGDYVYIIIESSSPLGDKYVVKRIDVTVEETDGALCAISSKDGKDDTLNQGMIVTRSEKPLHNGDRVRLEDYSNPGSGS